MPRETIYGVKRNYSKDAQEKIDNGEHWEFPYAPNKAVAKKLISEKEKTGASYRKIMDIRLAKSYGIKEKKK